MSVLAALAAIGVLALLVVVHELGHFLAARFQNIHVNRFSIGFGPILWKYQGPETEYAIRGFPLGGFVGFPDEDPESPIDRNDPNLLSNRPLIDRAIVISAGVIANLIFAYFLLVVYVGSAGIQELQPGVLISQTRPHLSVAAQAGIQPNDVVIAANGQELGDSKSAVKFLQAIIQTHPNQGIPLIIQRDHQKISLEVTPEKDPTGKGRIGVVLRPNDTKPGVVIDQLTPELGFAATADLKPGDVILAVGSQKLEMSSTVLADLQKQVKTQGEKPLQLTIQRGQEQLPIQVTPAASPLENLVVVQLAPYVAKHKASNLVEALSMGATEFERMTLVTVQGFYQLITHFKDTAGQIAGPVKIVEEGAKLAATNSMNLFLFAAFISINLAIINILPLPALDGGQLAFLLIEALRGKPLPTHVQESFMQTGLMLLLGLGIFLIIRDTANLEWVQQLIQQSQ